MNIPDLTDGFFVWQSTLPCRANQKTPFVDERVFQNRGVCGQAFPFLPSPPPSPTFLPSLQFSRVQKAKNASNQARTDSDVLSRINKSRAAFASLKPACLEIHCYLFENQNKALRFKC